MKKLLFIFPVLLFLGLFYKSLMGQPAMTLHGIDYYHIVKFFGENFTRGVFPAWDPFMFWGRPDTINARFIGEFNPFLWFYPIFSGVGISRHVAFVLYAFVYYFAGLWGFYLLARKFFRKTEWALLSTVLLMFSSLVVTIFNNYCITLLFVPMVWFFYFLYAFSEKPKKHYLLGLTFSIMLLLITYMPFYFLTIFFTFFILFCVIYPKLLIQIGRNIWGFIKRHKIFTMFCVVAILIACIPGLMWYLDAAKGEHILSWRHEGSVGQHTASMNIKSIVAGGILGPVTFRGLFSGLSFSMHLMFYLSGFVYIILLLSLVNRLNKRLILLMSVSFVVFLITLADLTPVHRFLYDHVYFFKLFRNLPYFIYFLLPFLILFCVEQLRLFLGLHPRSTKERTAILIYVGTVHVLFTLFLLKVGSVIWSSFFTVALSFIVFVVYFLGLLRKRESILTLLLLLLFVIQPVEVFYHYQRNSHSVVPWAPKDKFYPKFTFVRPSRKAERHHLDASALKISTSSKGIQDSSGFEKWKYDGLTTSYMLHENIDHDILESYVRHKFVIYDQVRVLDKGLVPFKTIEDALKKRMNVAHIYNNEQKGSQENDAVNMSSKYEVVDSNSPRLRVTRFDLNTITFETNFDQKKFLVYNDSYHKDWHGFINEEETEIFQSNYAFKGLWIPAGEQKIRLQFGKRWRYLLNGFIMVFFQGVFCYLICLSVASRRKVAA